MTVELFVYPHETQDVTVPVAHLTGEMQTYTGGEGSMGMFKSGGKIYLLTYPSTVERLGLSPNGLMAELRSKLRFIDSIELIPHIEQLRHLSIVMGGDLTYDVAVLDIYEMETTFPVLETSIDLRSLLETL